MAQSYRDKYKNFSSVAFRKKITPASNFYKLVMLRNNTSAKIKDVQIINVLRYLWLTAPQKYLQLTIWQE